MNKWIFLPVALILFTFFSSLFFDFVSDDIALLVNNDRLISSPIIDYFQHGVWKFSFLNIDEGQIYRPIALLNYRIQSLFWNKNPIGFHLINVLMHTAVTVLLFFILSYWLPSASERSIALAVSIFAVHPAQVESVCWILGGNDIWTAFWIFLSIMFSIKIHTDKYLFFILSLLAAFIAMLTKETAYIFPGILMLMMFFKPNELKTKKFMALIALSFFLLLIVLILRKNAVTSPGLVFNLENFGNAFVYFIAYVKMTLLPMPQRFYLSVPAAGILSSWEAVIGFLFVAGFFVLIWKIKDSRRFLILAAILYIIILAPVLGASFHAFRPVFASRLLYLALLPLSMVVLWFLNNASKKQRAIPERVAIGVIGIFVAISFFSSFSWRDRGSFLDLAIKSTPEKKGLYIDYGDYFAEKNMVKNAIESYNIVIASEVENKTKILAHTRLGEIYGKNKLLENARKEFEAILKLEPQNSSAMNGLGNLAWLSGDLISAKKYYETAVNYDVNNAIAKKNLDAVDKLLNGKQ